MFRKFYHAVAEAMESIAMLKDTQVEMLKNVRALQGQLSKLIRTPVTPQPPPERSQELTFDYEYHPKVRTWEDTRAIRQLREIMAGPTQDYEALLDQLASFLPFFEAIPVHGPRDALTPYWVNGWFPAIDSITLYGLLALRNPRAYVEIGSGNSTKFARQAIKDHALRTKIISIDPSPRAEIDQLCDRTIRQACEDVETSFFESLTSEDVLFADNSHRSFQNSDVTVFFMEVLPALPKGTLVGLHDIFLPDDYIRGWEDRYYNEQYLLAAYIFGGMGGGSILLPNWHVSKEPTLKARLDPVWKSAALAGLEDRGGAFWLIK
ncbi:MAG: class I SAM-dependent methyltransferase [Rhodopila sp.]